MPDAPSRAAPALLSAGCGGAVLAAAAGRRLAVRCKDGSCMAIDAGEGGVFIALCVHASGDFVAAATDDKHVSVYDLARPTNFRRVVYRAPTPKRASAVCFAGGAAAGAADDEGEWLLVADKWGDVFGIAMTEVWPPCEVGLAPDAESRPLSLVLGHCCSIIGSLAASPCGAALATGDRDGRCRLTAWPRGGSLNREMCGARGGAAEVLSFCLGHEDFLTKVAFVEGVPGAADADGEGDGDAVLVTCGGDGSVRVWAWRSGEELARWDCAREEGACKAVVDVVSLGGGALAAAVEDAPGVTVLLLTDGGRRLAVDTARSEALSSALAAARELGAPPCGLARVCIEGDAALAAAAVRAKSAEELVASVAIEGDADTSEVLTAALNEERVAAAEGYEPVQLAADLRKRTYNDQETKERLDKREAGNAAKRARKAEQREHIERKRRDEGIL